MSIKKTVYVTQKQPITAIDVTYGSAMPIELALEDYTFPDGTKAIAYAKSWDKPVTYKNKEDQTTTAGNNRIIINPESGLFVPGMNWLQIVLTVNSKPIKTFRLPVKCDVSLDTGEVKEPEIVVDLVDQAKQAAASSAASAAGAAETLETLRKDFPEVPELATGLKELKEDISQTKNRLSESIVEIDAEVLSMKNIADNGNFFNGMTELKGTDIMTNTGKLVPNVNYKTSAKIYMDFSKPLYFKNVYGNYAYCYSESEYFGRVNIETQNRYITSIYPNVKYIRVLMTSSATDVFVGYWRSGTIPYVSYNPFGEWIKEYEKHKVTKLRIASYNTGDFTGNGLTPNTLDTAIEYRKTISELNADYVGFQYDTVLMNQRQAYEYIFRKFFKWGVANGSRMYDYFSSVSKYEPVGMGTVDYTERTAFSHSFFQYYDMEIEGKKLHIVNIHFEWRSVSERASQITQVLAHCANYDNCIVLGDFNPEERDGDRLVRLTYEEDLNRFINEGFTPCNANVDYLGVVNTIGDGQLVGPWDNILVKGNISVCSFGKIEKAWMNDHYPVYADIILY